MKQGKKERERKGKTDAEFRVERVGKEGRSIDSPNGSVRFTGVEAEYFPLATQ